MEIYIWSALLHRETIKNMCKIVGNVGGQNIDVRLARDVRKHLRGIDKLNSGVLLK